MIFAQLANRESLRDLINSLSPFKDSFNHLGFGQNVSRNNLSKANEIREVKIFEAMANLMIKIAQKKRGGIVNPFLDLDAKVYAFDSSTIPLCLNIFWWSRLHHNKGAVKLHTMYDVVTDIPVFNIITNGNVHDSKIMDLIPYNRDDYYVFDRAYMDTTQLNAINNQFAYFVVREKHSMKYTVTLEKQSNNASACVMADQLVILSGNKTKKQYKNEIRRIVFYDKENNRTFVFYTNSLDLEAEKIALLYKYRWKPKIHIKTAKCLFNKYLAIFMWV